MAKQQLHNVAPAGVATTRRPRPRVARTAILLAIATLLLFITVGLSHRHFNRTLPLQRLERFADQVRPTVAQTGRLPDLTRWIEGEWSDKITHKADAWTRRYAAGAREPVIAAASMLHMPLSQAGRAVLLYEQQQLDVVWMAESDFTQRLEDQRQAVEAARKKTRHDSRTRSSG
jgi:hypothetical protein